MGDQELSEFDPSLGNLSTQMRRLNFDQWFAALQHVLRVLYLMCRRVQNIQEVILDNINHFSETIARRPMKEQEIIEKSVFHGIVLKFKPSWYSCGLKIKVQLYVMSY